MVEAQACGVPVIVSNIEGLNEVVSDRKTGLLFELDNDKELAEQIMLLYTDNMLRDNMAKSALLSVQKYSLDNYVTNTDGIYRGLVK